MSRTADAAESIQLTAESLLAEGVLLAAGVPWDVVLRRGGVLCAVMLPDKDVLPLPVMLPKEGDPEHAQITMQISWQLLL